MNYEIHFYNARWWVTANGRLLGGYSFNGLRAYVFPLYTANGTLVLQESPADHPHHQGICAGLNIDGYDLWNAGSFNVPKHRIEPNPPLSDLQPAVSESGVRFDHRLRWLTVEGQELLLEHRRVQLSFRHEVTVVEWRSEFSHPHKACLIGKTKESGIGLRVPPNWETKWGGQIRNAMGATGEKECFDVQSPWLNIEGPPGRAQAGLVFVPGADTEHGPWFTRDYGLHVYNPARWHACELSPGQSLAWEVMVLAYDGTRIAGQIEEMVKEFQE